METMVDKQSPGTIEYFATADFRASRLFHYKVDQIHFFAVLQKP
ncbi:MAG: hypothetical protein V4564_19585 [Pseudomonadota bacterium]|nr:hypothetical protein [Sphingomonas sp. ERG5]